MALDLPAARVADDACRSIFEQFCEFIAANRIVFLLDGFDEICLANRASVNQVALRPLFQLPAVLSCRKSYFELYLRASPIHERFGEQARAAAVAVRAIRSALRRCLREALQAGGRPTTC